MTDNEIIKAFDDLVRNKIISLDLPLIIQKLSADVLVVLNRQNAEIERLRAYNHNLLSANVRMSCNWLDEIKKAKSEAVREFAERAEKALIERVSERIRERNPHWYVAIRVVRETKMEMVGDE